MEDKVIMNTALTFSKNACELLLHGSIESSTPKVKSTFMDGLNKALTMQGDIFKEMEVGGLYNIEDVQQSKIDKAYKKYIEK